MQLDPVYICHCLSVHLPWFIVAHSLLDDVVHMTGTTVLFISTLVMLF